MQKNAWVHNISPKRGACHVRFRLFCTMKSFSYIPRGSNSERDRISNVAFVISYKKYTRGFCNENNVAVTGSCG